MEDVVALLIPIACGCVLPIMAIWFGVRQKMNETNKRTQIILAAIEKNSETDIEELLKKMTPKQKLLKEKLLTKLLWGCLCAMLGLGLIGFGLYLGYAGYGGKDDPMTAIGFGVTLLAIGIAFLVNYCIGKKLLTKEMAAEEKEKVERAEING
ncbi:MAG: hypothetical protein K5945_07135 [Bacteroidaceae bacterium]|nr:hypothetical protein [Bacteroidaceae bacterium]